MKTENYMADFLADLTRQEVNERHEKTSAKIVELQKIQNEKKARMAHYGSEEKRLNEEIARLGGETYNRKGIKAIEVMEVVGGPNTIQVVEATNPSNVLDTRSMTDEELADFKQGKLFGQAHWSGVAGPTGRGSKKRDDDTH